MNRQKRQVSLKTMLDQIHLEMSKISDEHVLIRGVAADSRMVQPGDLFVAIPGAINDGHSFIPDAIDKGAVAVVGMEEIDNLRVPYIRVENSQRALAHLVAAYYGFPAKKLVVIGVTGTDGKTTTINLIYEILHAAGIFAGMISTVNAVIGDQLVDTGFHVTTPDAPDIQRYLASMVDAGLTHVLLEATSHGLSQYRVEACEFDIGVLTNITHEHLDFHGTYTKYREAKTKLFDYLATTADKPSFDNRIAILNKDDSSYGYLEQKINVRKLSYGTDSDSDIRAEHITQSLDGLEFDVVLNGRSYKFNTGLLGFFNVSNILAAVATAVSALNVDINFAISAVASFHAVPGRMEMINLGQDFYAIVDFAHTPNALKSALQAARRLSMGNIIAVFGSAGLRDRAKRRMMAEISLQLADYSIFTAEDPRTENLEDILSEMAAGALSLGGREDQNFWRVPDRGAAIQYALQLARPNDVVIVCGKGHEQSMCFGQIEYAWDDRVALQAALSKHLGLPGPEMPYLPTQDQ